MGSAPRRLEPSACRRILQSLEAVAPESWPPGATWASEDGRALVRVGDPEPGEGHHREHVRLLRGAGAPSELTGLLEAVVGELDPRLRLETRAVEGLEEAWAAAVRRCGLDDEGRLPEAWRDGEGRLRDLLHFGRRAVRRPSGSPPAPAAPRAAAAPPGAALRIVPHGEATRAALADFLDSLVPGRAYPPGALLSEAERREGRRVGDLEGEWVLALSGKRVVAGAILQPLGRPERRHVRRLHVDVSPDFRGRGLAKALLLRARRRAAELGLRRVEADPRGGHLVVRRALQAAGLVECVVQGGAWRMRTAAAAWDEDVLLLSAPAAPRP